MSNLRYYSTISRIVDLRMHRKLGAWRHRDPPTSCNFEICGERDLFQKVSDRPRENDMLYKLQTQNMQIICGALSTYG